MDTGYIKLFRKMMDWEWYGDLATFRVFTHLLLKANYKETKWRGKTVERGTCITSQSKLADETGLTVQQVKTAIKHLVSTNEVTKSGTSKYTMIKVLNYDCYQATNQVTNQQPTNEQPAINQPVNQQLTSKLTKYESQENTINKGENYDCYQATNQVTNQQDNQQQTTNLTTSKEEKNKRNINIIKEENKQRRKDDNSSVDEIKRIVEYLNLKTGKSFKHTTQNTKSHIQARIADGYAFDDFKKVIDKKVLDWGNSEKMKNYLRPSTLFAPTNFENYLNESEVVRDEDNTGNAWCGITSL